MNRKSIGGRALLWAGMAVAIVVGCYSAPVPINVAAPTVDRLTTSNVSPAELEAGRAIYVSTEKCAHCHRPKPVFLHSKKDWAYRIMPQMGKKAELTHEEYDSVLAYIEAASTVQPSAAK